MTAWEQLTAGSTIRTGTAWEHLNAQGGGEGDTLSIVVEAGVDIDNSVQSEVVYTEPTISLDSANVTQVIVLESAIIRED